MAQALARLWLKRCILLLLLSSPLFALPQPSPLRVEQISVFPDAVTLKGREAQQRIVVTAKIGDFLIDVTSQCRFLLPKAGFFQITPEGILTPVRDGAGFLTVVYGNYKKRLRVKVVDSQKTEPVLFDRDIIPLFTKIGCNSGACHGAASGKNGFKLSLRGYDPSLDYEQIVQAEEGKRVNLKVPERSLILMKPSLQVPHGGGLRLPRGSPEYRLLLRWIREGSKPPTGEVRTTTLQVYPKECLFEHPGQAQQLVVLAQYSNGSFRDVTRLARYISSDEAVISIDEDGKATAQRPGEAVIMVSYDGLVEAPRFILPVGKTPPDPKSFPFNNKIDELVFKKLVQLRIQPSSLARDEEFLRRVYLDTLGILPTLQETLRFLRDRRLDKRQRLIDELLERPEFVDYRTLKLAEMLRVNSQFLSEEGSYAYYRWLHNQVEKNTPYDQLVRALLTARGATYRAGPANYFRVAPDAKQMAETTSQLFLGIRLQCAQCHNHPFERWTQKDYYSFSAFFARVSRKGGPEFGEEHIFIRTAGEMLFPKTNQPIKPKFLGAEEPTIPEGVDRREVLAQWLTNPQNKQFARNAVNRLWADFFGRGIVDPVDDLRISNPASNPELLDWLAEEFIRSGYNIKHIIRLILNSRTYQLSSLPTPTNQRDSAHFARASLRRLTAETLADAIGQVTGKYDRYGLLPPGTRASQIPDSRVGSYLLEVFGRPKREILCACERSSQPNLAQSLFLINSNSIQQKLQAEDGWLALQIKAGRTDSDIITDLYLSALSRYPKSQELKTALRYLRESKDRKTGLEDIVWAILNSQEFLFNH